MYLYPTTLIVPAKKPIRIAPHGSITILASVPTATPPANVAFCTCTCWGNIINSLSAYYNWHNEWHCSRWNHFWCDFKFCCFNVYLEFKVMRV